ncbi:MAG: HD domain-containing protein [Patescibacteria group bacterium]|nr:HD domain-containing protein [Patescibacteria group bacterium]
MRDNLIQKTAEFVKKKLYNEATGHDWYHVERVWKMAKRLQIEEGGDLELIELTALLHDLGDYKQYEFNEFKGSLVLHGMMDVMGIEPKKQEKILQIVSEAQYNGDETKTPKTIESRIIQDADWLDALGAIGIARTFATGGRIKRMIHDPKRKPRKKLSKADYQKRKQEGTSFNYFFEKVLKLPKMLNTKTARNIAGQRSQFLKKFIKEFLEEWEGKK